MKKSIFIIILSVLPSLLSAQDESFSEKIRLLERRIAELESDITAYKENYMRLETLFMQTIDMAKTLLEQYDDMHAAAVDVADHALRLEEKIDRTLSDAGDIIEFLQNKVVERSTLFIETTLSWHALLGAGAQATFVWEPLSWLGFKGGIEVWYTDSVRLAIPVSVYLRLKLN